MLAIHLELIGLVQLVLPVLIRLVHNVSTDLSTGKLSGGVGPLDYSIRCNEKLTEHQAVLALGKHTFINGSYSSIQPQSDDFCYCDPPYLASGFKYSGWTEKDERDLLDWLDHLPCEWALSNTLQSGTKVNTILESWCRNKKVIELEKNYRKWAGAGSKSVDKAAKINREVLILSYETCSPRDLFEDL